MTVAVETLIDRSLRNMGPVHPLVREKITKDIREAYSRGVYAQISSGYRSFAEQTRLYAKGRTAPGDVVTNAEAGESVHNYGLAVDFFIVSDDGQRALWIVNQDWMTFVHIAKSMSFFWGGDWKSFVDNPHLQLTEGLGWRDLMAGSRPSFWGSYILPQGPKAVDIVAAKADGLLERGESGQSVRELQKNLNSLGYDLKVDGIYGQHTEDDVKDFQEKHDLKVDGIYGPNTRATLREELAAGEDLVERGDRGQAVENVQRQLVILGFDISIDGVFGPKTQHAVRLFQEWAELSVDGIVGPNTKEAFDYARTYPGHYIQRGDEGPWTEQAQRKINVEIDGVFGPVTEGAVWQWQKDHGLLADGILGPQTFTAMFG